MHDRTGWKRSPHLLLKNHGRHLTEYRRPCATCDQPFSIFVTQRIADGDADTNNFALRNCEQHRRRKKMPWE